MGMGSREEEEARLAQSFPGGIRAQLEGPKEQRLEPARATQGEVEGQIIKSFFVLILKLGIFSKCSGTNE